MKLPKLTRKRLYTGAQTSFNWPKGATPPKVGRTYKIETDQKGPAEYAFEVLKAKERHDGTFTVTARLHADPVRLLARGLGYTNFKGRSLEDEDPAEACPPSDIAHYRHSREARERFKAEQADQIGGLIAAVSEVRGAIAAMDPEVRRKVSREVWTLRGRLDALERKIKRQLAA